MGIQGIRIIDAAALDHKARLTAIKEIVIEIRICEIAKKVADGDGFVLVVQFDVELAVDGLELDHGSRKKAA